MALLDEIKKRLSGGAPNPPAGMGAQSAAQSILGTKATGKAAVGAPAQVSNVQEKVAQQQADTQMAQVEEAGQMQAQQLGQQQAQTEQTLESAKADLEAKRQDAEQKQAVQWQMGENARAAQMDESMAKLGANEQAHLAQLSAQYNQRVKQLASDRGIAEDDIFEQFRQGDSLLEDRKDAAQLEQLAFDMRLSDTQYIDNLNRVGKTRQLENELEFRKEATRLRMGNETALLMENYGFMNAYNQNSRQFAESMNDMSIANALAISEAMAKDASRAQMVSGAMGLGQAAISAYEPSSTPDRTGAAPTRDNATLLEGGGPVREAPADNFDFTGGGFKP